MKCCKKCKRVLILTKDGVTSYLCGETNDHVNGNSICKGFKRYHQKGWFKSLYIKFLEWQLRMLSE
jgi:hypothetical protein